MARLTAVKSRLSAPAPRVGTAIGDAKAQDRERNRIKPWRAWYSTARWRKLRLAALERDGYVCRQTGEPLVGKAGAPNSPVVDHIEEHLGDPTLFWDLENLQSVTKEWHDQAKQREERARHG